MSELYSDFISQITLWQYSLNKAISSSIRGAEDTNSVIVYATVLAIAFLYGVIHAAGPGHGKALVALYFTKGKNNYKDAFTIGYLISIIHAISAVVITFVLYFIFQTMFRQNFNQFSNYAMLVSSLLIITIGIYLIIKAVLEKKKKLKDEEQQYNQTNKSKYSIALSVGIVPCPGVMTIVLFCILLKKFMLGILAAITMSIGMGLTISIVGILSVVFAKRTEKFVNQKGYILEIISGVLIILLGVFLLSSVYTSFIS